MGKSSQRKGAAGEQELAGILRRWGYSIQRGGSLSFGEAPDLVGLPGVHIEVKRVERLNVGEAMGQAVRDSERFQDGAPALFHRRNRQPWLVTMLFDDWMELYAPLNPTGEPITQDRGGTHRSRVCPPPLAGNLRKTNVEES